MPEQKIGRISLKNSGLFVARVQCAYLDDRLQLHLSPQSGDLTLGFTKEVDPSDLAVPDGAIVFLHVDVVWGHDNETKQGFRYERGHPTTAYYTISGTTLNNDLGLVKIE
jgi:hypothetical protein